ncbi:MAG: S-layer homology domain-containing protein [Clostridia bacterium]|nr:S-layer homology domain-containing protein [Clostridia bacterium]
MKKVLVKILSLVICLSLINLPVFSVSADDGLIEMVEDFSTYNSESDFIFEWGVNTTSTTATPGFSDGSYNIIQTSSIPKNASGANNGTFAPEVYGKFAYEKVDAENKTVTKSKKLQGVYEVTLDLEYKALTSTNAYYYIFFGDLGDVTTLVDKQKATAAKVRLQKTAIGVFNNNSANTTTLTNGSHSNSADGNNTLKFTVDTNNDTVEVEVNGNTEKISTGSTMHNIDAISGFVFQSMERFDVDSYLKIKKLTVKELASDAGSATHAVLDNLPAKLADDIDGVTEDITLMEATGLTWTSSDESVITNSGVVTRADEDKEVTLTATVDLGNGGGVYTKEYTMTVKKKEAPVIPDEPDEPVIPDEPEEEDAVYKVVVDYTKLNDITEVADISTTLGGYADVKVTKGVGFEIVQTGSHPVVNGATNTNVSPTVHLAFQGVIDEDADNNTQLRISKFGGKLKVAMDIAVKNDSYKEAVNGTTVGTPYYTMFYGFSPSLGSETSVTFAHVNYRVRSANATIMNTTKAADNSMVPSTLRYTSYVDHKFTTYIDTYSKATKVDMDGQISEGDSQLASYFNGITITGQDRMLVGSYFNLKKVEISLLEENDDYKAVREKLESLPATLVENPDAVTENITLPDDPDIKWTTSDSEICDEFGNIVRWYSDRTVTLTATYGVGHTVMHKDYILNIKAMDNVESDVISSANGNDISNLLVYGDKVACEYVVSDKGLAVTKNVANSGEYTIKYPLFGEVVAYNDSAKSAVSMTGYSGIYDVNFKVTSNVSGDKPVYMYIDNDDALGYGIEVASNSVSLVCANGNKIALAKESTYGKTYDITLRADTANNKVWAFVNGELKTASVQFADTDDGYLINMLNVVVPADCCEGDGIVVDAISVTEYVANMLETKSELEEAFKVISISDVVDNASNAQALKTLAKDIEGFKVKWSSNSDLVNVESGEVYHGSNDETVILSAIINKDGIYAKKDFYLTVLAAKNNDEQLEYYIWDLPQAITSQPANNICYNINLPSTHRGLGITWTSSREDIINTSGVINTSATVTEPTQVVLAAHINFNGGVVTKDYTYTVSPCAGEYVVYSGNELPASFTVDGTENVKVTDTVIATINLTQNGAENSTVELKDSMGNTAAKIVVNNNMYYVVYGNGTTDKYAMPAGTAKELKIAILPDASKIAVWDGELRIADYVDTINTISDFAGFAVKGEGIAVNSASVKTDLYGMLNINLANVDYFAPFAKGVVKGSVAPVTDTVVACDVDWKSSDASLITDNGTVTVPDMYKFATMTLTLTANENSAVKISVPVTFAVACNDGKNLLASATVKATAMDKPGYPIVYATDNDVNTVYGISNAAKSPVITFDMGSVKYVNTLYISENKDHYEKGIKSYKLSYSVDGETWTVAKTGTFAKPQDYLVAIGNVQARYFELVITDAYSKDVYFNEVEAYLFGTSADLIGLELDAIDLGIESTVSSDIDLPKSGVFGTTFEWTSSHPEIIDENGKVTRPEKGTTVKLTVTAIYDGVKYTRDFAVYVNGKKAAGGSSGGGGGSAGGAGGTGTSTVPGFAVTDVPEVKEEVKEEVVTPQVSIFADMDENHWAYENVAKLKELGIVNGDDAGNFNPSANVTREQFLKMLVEATDINVNANTTSFEDVDGNAWYAPYVAAGVEAGLVNGITADTFGIGSQIKRQDMAVMIVRILEGKNIPVTQTSEVFDDDSDITDYAKNAVYKVRDAGIINGYADGTFSPNASLTRAEAATVIIKLLDLLK